MINNFKAKRKFLREHLVSGLDYVPMQVEEADAHKCQNCGTEYRGNFCPSCGQSAATKRFTTKETLRNLVFLFAKFDSAFWRTAFELFYRPGHMVRDYLTGHRKSYLAPMKMLVFLVTVYVLASHFIFPDYFDEVSLVRMENTELQELFKHNPALQFMYNMLEAALSNRLVSTLIFTVLSILPNWLCFRKCSIAPNMLFGAENKRFPLNLAEHFYALIYLSCQSMILLILQLPITWLSSDAPKNSLDFFISFFLFVWMFKQLYQITWKRSFGLALLADVLMIILLVLLAVVVTLFFLSVGIIGYDSWNDFHIN